MDVYQPNIKFLGIFGIFREAINIINTGRRIFTQITLSLILPLSFLSFTYFIYFLPKIIKFYDLASSERIYFLLFIFAYLIVCTALSLVAIYAVVYTVACIYTGHDITFKQVIAVKPNVLKRLFVTFRCVSRASFIVLFVVSLLYFIIVVVIILNYGPLSPGNLMILSSLFFFFFGFAPSFYMSIIWQLSNIISVLEDSKGFKAMAKSKELLKGKMLMATMIPILLSFPFSAIQLVFYYLVLPLVTLGVVIKGILGIVCFLLFPGFILLSLVTETVLYFVCKSYHNEDIEKSNLSEQLQVYQLEDYTPLKVKHVDDEKLEIV